MNAYIKTLDDELRADQQKREESRRRDLQATKERLSPLQERLSRLLTTIPVEIQTQGLSLDSLRVGLRGRWRGNCHPGELGVALRKLGFRRERRWRSGEGFRALWLKD